MALAVALVICRGYNQFIGSAAAQAGGLATSAFINLSIIIERATPASPISIKGLTPVEYYLPLGRVSFGQPIQAFLLGPPYPTPNIAQWLGGGATASAVSLDLVPPALHHGERTDHAWDIS